MERQRAYELLDAGDRAHGRSRAVRVCEMAQYMYEQHGGDMTAARGLFRECLSPLMQGKVLNPDYGSMYRGWISMESHAGNADFARALFEEWRGLGGSDDGGFWCHLITFEARHGHGGRAREVYEAAVRACPGDPAVHAVYAKLELRLGHKDVAFTVLGRALAAFESDAAAKVWLVEQVHGYRDDLRRHTLAGRIRSCCHGVKRFLRPHPHGYAQLQSM